MSLKLIPKEELPSATIPVPFKEQGLPSVFKVIKEMEVLCEKHDGIGLAAAQVGIPWKLCILKQKDRWRYLINCEYSSLSDDKISVYEGCLTIPNEIFLVPRLVAYRLTGLELIIDKNELKLVEILEDYQFIPSMSSQQILDHIVVLHEIDHQNDILIWNIGEPYDVTRMQASR